MRCRKMIQGADDLVGGERRVQGDEDCPQLEARVGDLEVDQFRSFGFGAASHSCKLDIIPEADCYTVTLLHTNVF